MDYQKHYNNLMESRLLLKTQRYQKSAKGYNIEYHNLLK